jgi:hypothetical protein
MTPEPISTAFFINLSHQSVRLYVYNPLSLLGNGSVDIFQRQRIHEINKNSWTRCFLYGPRRIRGKSMGLSV